LSFTFPRIVDGKADIIVTVNLSNGTLVYNFPSEFQELSSTDSWSNAEDLY